MEGDKRCLHHRIRFRAQLRENAASSEACRRTSDGRSRFPLSTRLRRRHDKNPVRAGRSDRKLRKIAAARVGRIDGTLSVVQKRTADAVDPAILQSVWVLIGYGHAMLVPPSTWRVIPVAICDSAEAKKRAAPTKSSGFITFPNGIRARRAFKNFSSSRSLRLMSVSVSPGESALTRIPYCASSKAIHFVNIATPALETQ